MTDFPIILGPQGRQNTSPEVLRANLVALAESLSPGITTDLPGSLIEDIASTDVGALVGQDQMVTELINSLTPRGANAFVLNQLGQIYGASVGQNTNTSVFLVFSGTIGFVIAKGFTISDGTHQYIIQDGGIIGGGGASVPLFAVATVAGSWAVPINTVNQLITSVPATITLSVTNPTTGTPSTGVETEESYRARVLQAGLAVAQGMPSLLRTLLGEVPGVQQRLIAVQQGSGGWKIIVGGGDPYLVADAIFTALFDISVLVGSTTTIRNITVSIVDSPDVYEIIYVNPPQQQVGVILTWNTDSPNTVSPAAVAQLGQVAIQDYVNGIAVGQPINLFEMQAVFQQAVVSLVDTPLLSRMVFAVSIDGVGTPPVSGTGLVVGDSESYFQTNLSLITISQG